MRGGSSVESMKASALPPVWAKHSDACRYCGGGVDDGQGVKPCVVRASCKGIGGRACRRVPKKLLPEPPHHPPLRNKCACARSAQPHVLAVSRVRGRQVRREREATKKKGEEGWCLLCGWCWADERGEMDDRSRLSAHVPCKTSPTFPFITTLCVSFSKRDGKL